MTPELAKAFGRTLAYSTILGLGTGALTIGAMRSEGWRRTALLTAIAAIAIGGLIFGYRQGRDAAKKERRRP